MSEKNVKDEIEAVEKAEEMEAAKVIDEGEAVEEEAVIDEEVTEEAEITEEEDEEEGLEDLSDDEILDEETFGKKPKKDKKGFGKKLLKILALIIIFIAVIYFAGVAFFSQFFMYGTSVDMKDYSFKSVENVQQDQEDLVNSYVLTLHTIDDQAVVIGASDMGLQYVETEELAAFKAQQDPFMWPKMFFESYDYTTTTVVDYDQATLEATIAGLDCMVEANMEAPQDAYPEFQETKYVIIPHAYGTVIDKDNFIAAVEAAVVGLQADLDMETAECYVLPAVVAESENLIAHVEELNSYLAATITYEEGCTLDEATISSWLVVDGEEITFSDEKISEFVSGLNDEYTTVGTTRTFTAADGASAQVSGGTYGWKVDQEAEIEQIKTDLEAGVPVERTICYSSKANSFGAMDWGNSYTEIDLTDQKVYYIQNGEVVVEGSIVTGDVDGGNATPQGVYPLSYKTTNAVLRGQRAADGTYAYESPVSYWMPFNRGIGMHDASWRSEFGGSIYKTSGSHGCINMTYSTAQAMYSHVSSGDPIICHY